MTPPIPCQERVVSASECHCQVTGKQVLQTTSSATIPFPPLSHAYQESVPTTNSQPDIFQLDKHGLVAMFWRTVSSNLGAILQSCTTVAVGGYLAYSMLQTLSSSSTKGSAKGKLTEYTNPDNIEPTRTQQILSICKPAELEACQGYTPPHLPQKRKALEAFDDLPARATKRTRSEPPHAAYRLVIPDGNKPLTMLRGGFNPPPDFKHTVDTESECSDESVDDAAGDIDKLGHFHHVKTSINFDALKQVALRTRRQIQHHLLAESDDVYGLEDDLACDIVGEPQHGTFNIVYTLKFSDGIQWVTRIPGHGDSFEPLDKIKMDSEYQTMRHLRDETTIPLPTIHYWTTENTEIGSAFALMQCMDGFSLNHLWDTELTEHQRLRILSDVAKYMSQLQKLRYDSVGILRHAQGTGTPVIGPQIYLTSTHLETNDVPWGEAFEDQQYGCYADHLESSWDQCQDLPKRFRCEMAILQLAVESIPDHIDMACGKSIHMPDLNSHNVLIDKHGTISAFLDWDMVGTAPTSVGSAKFPPWIAQEWLRPQALIDELEEENDEEDCDDDVHRDTSSSTFAQMSRQMSRYRQYYAAVYSRCMARTQEHYDPRTTTASHVLEALEVAINHREERPAIVVKLLDHAFDGDPPFSLKEYGDACMNDDTNEYNEMIRKAFKTMWHAEWEQPQYVNIMLDADGDRCAAEAIRGHQVTEEKVYESAIVEEENDICIDDSAGSTSGSEDDGDRDDTQDTNYGDVISEEAAKLEDHREEECRAMWDEDETPE